MKFEIISDIIDIEIIAVGRAIRELPQLQERFGRGRWRKLKGIATVHLLDNTVRLAEVHWYEAHESASAESRLNGFWINHE